MLFRRPPRSDSATNSKLDPALRRKDAARSRFITATVSGLSILAAVPFFTWVMQQDVPAPPLPTPAPIPQSTPIATPASTSAPTASAPKIAKVPAQTFAPPPSTSGASGTPDSIIATDQDDAPDVDPSTATDAAPNAAPAPTQAAAKAPVASPPSTSRLAAKAASAKPPVRVADTRFDRDPEDIPVPQPRAVPAPDAPGTSPSTSPGASAPSPSTSGAPGTFPGTPPSTSTPRANPFPVPAPLPGAADNDADAPDKLPAPPRTPPSTSTSTSTSTSSDPEPASSTPPSTSTSTSGGSTAPSSTSTSGSAQADAVGVDEGISSRTQTSDNNRLSPQPSEAKLPRVSVSSPVPSVNTASVNEINADRGTEQGGEIGLDQPGLSEPITGETVAGGGEKPGQDFGLEVPDNPVLYDTERGIAIAQGDVNFSYGNFRARGKRGVVYYNSAPRIARLSDDLTITARLNGRDVVFRGQALEFDLDTGKWRLTDVRATFPPELFPRGQVLEPFYLRDGAVFGTNEDVNGRNLFFSSCDHDHYAIASRQINFYRDERGRPDRIVLRRNGLFLFGKRVLPLPNFVYSLQGQRSRRFGLQPQVGRNEVDGFFAKTILDLGATANRTDSLLVDVLEKRGLALGFNRELAGDAGLFYLYALNRKVGGRQIDARIRRNFNIGSALRSTVSFESSSNNSLAGEGYGNTNGSLSFDYAPQSGGSGNVALQINNSKTPFSTFSQQSGTVSFNRQLGSAWDVTLGSRYNASSSGDSGTFNGGTASSDRQATLDNDISVERRGIAADARLRAELHDDLTGQNQRNGAYQLERLPELELTSDTQRLVGGALDRALPGSLSLSVGQFNEPSTLARLGRARFEYQAKGREIRLVNAGGFRSSINVDGRAAQNAYSDNTARYDYSYGASFVVGAGRVREEERDGAIQEVSPLEVRATYAKLRPFGFTPFQFDFLSPNEIIDVSGILSPSRNIQLELAGGRDLQNGISRDVTGTLRVTPSRSVALEVLTAYSLEQKFLADVAANILISRPRQRFGGGTISVGLLYSPEQKLFSRINVGADVQLGPKTRLQVLTSYSGFTKEFDQQQFRVVRDIHCFNVYAGYDGQRKQFRFDLALKALPFVDSRLGQSILGEGFDSALGGVR